MTLRRAPSYAVLVALVAGLSGCDVLLVDPAPTSGIGVEVTFDPARAGVGDDVGENIGWGVREVWLRFVLPNRTRDTVVAGRFESGELRATVWLHPEELSHLLELEAEVRLPNGLVLFVGDGSVQYRGPAPVARVRLAPRPALAFLVEGRVGLSRLDGSLHLEHDVTGVVGQPGQHAGLDAIDTSPRDGSVVYQTRPPGGGHWNIATMDPYTGQSRRLVHGEVGGVPPGQYSPRFSPDGRWIYFVGWYAGDNWELWRIRPDGSDAGRIQGLSVTSAVFAPAPSHDGTRLAYRTDAPTLGELRILDLATRTTRTTGVSDVTSARWSPDDQWIAYREYRSPEGGRLRLIRVDGTEDRPLAPDLAVGPGFDWEDDGASIVAATEPPYFDIPRPRYYHAVRIDVLTGAVDTLSSLGPVHSIAVAP